jgi:hypothetical protein
VLLVGACSPARFDLDTATAPPGVSGCVGAGAIGPELLTGDAASRPNVWIAADLGKRLSISWPPGYYATFDQGLRVMNPAGAVVAKGGDDISNDGVWLPELVICAGPTQVYVWRSADLAK